MIGIIPPVWIAWSMDFSAKDSVSALGIIVSGGFVAFKYMEAKRIERSAAGNRLIAELESDEWLRLSCQMLDWGARRFLLPEEILKRRIPKAPGDEDGNSILVHSSRKMLSALRPQDEYSADEVLYRDAFDALLTWLDRLHAALESGIFAARDVRPVAYYVDSLFAPRHHGPEAAATIQEFLRTYYDIRRFERLRERLARC